MDTLQGSKDQSMSGGGCWGMKQGRYIRDISIHMYIYICIVALQLCIYNYNLLDILLCSYTTLYNYTTIYITIHIVDAYICISMLYNYVHLTIFTFA